MAYAMAAMAAVQMVGSYYAAQAARETAKLNNEISEWNAEFAELDAHDAILTGESQKANYQQVIDQTLSDQNVAFAVNDVDATYGSAASVQQETRFIAELNRMEIEKRANEQALGYKKQARDFRLQAGVQLAADLGRASDIQRDGIFKALKTGISGYGSYSGGPAETPADTNGGDGWGLDTGSVTGGSFSSSGYKFDTGGF